MTQPETPAISVVVPTFNDVGRLGDALTSIVDQTLPPTEIVVSDDGSDDGTDQFVRQFASRHAGGVIIRYIRLSSRSGVVAARNEGIADPARARRSQRSVGELAARIPLPRFAITCVQASDRLL